MILRLLRKFLSFQREELAVGQWPMRWRDRIPAISDGWGREKRNGRGHLGVDLMFRRPGEGEEDRPERTKWYECPTGVVEAVACSHGRVVRVVVSPEQGIAVYLKHGRYMSVYRHLARLHVVDGDWLSQGSTIGIVGHAPKAGKRGINHLHFEIWDTTKPGKKWNRRRKAVDPEPWLKRWRRA